jgi:hypothetical protein
MKRRRLASAVAAAIAVQALGLGLNGAASARTISAGFYAKQIVVFDCQGHPHVRPGRYTLACADGNDYLSGLTWTSWGPRLASATGTEHVNDCVPYCAAGHFHSYPVIVVLWGSKAVKGHPGERCYTKLTEILTGQRPRYYDAVHHKWVTAPVTQTMPLLTSGHGA